MMLTEQYRQEAEERYASLQFSDDFLFCKILTENEDITRELLELILDTKIGGVRVNKQETIDLTSDGRGIRLDVYAEDDENEVFDVEMQTTRQKNLPKRSRYYQGMIDLNLINRGDDFKKLKKSFVIFICMSDPFPGYDRCIYRFENVCREEFELALGDETYKVFLNADGTKGDVSDELKDFLHLLRDGYGKSQLVKKIEEQVVKAREHKEWRLEYMTLYMRDRQNREEGFEEGLEKGIKKGIEEGLEKGLEQGLKEERKNTIKSALAGGMTVDSIVKMFGYSVEEVQAVADEYLLVSASRS